MIFMPKDDEISRNRDFHIVEDLSAELHLWLKAQTTGPLPKPTEDTSVTDSVSAGS